MKTPNIKIYQSTTKDKEHYIFRTQNPDVPKTIEEYVNNQTPVGVIYENTDPVTHQTITNMTMTIDESPIGYKGFTALSLPFEFNVPGDMYRIELKNNVAATNVVNYTIHVGSNVISSIDEDLNGTVTTYTDPTYIDTNFKILGNALLINSGICNYTLANFYGTVNTYNFVDDGTQTRPDVTATRAHGVYKPKMVMYKTSKYISFYQDVDFRKNTYYYNVVSKSASGDVSEISNTQAIEVAENAANLTYILEESNDYFTNTTPTWTEVARTNPADDIRVFNKDIISTIIPTANFGIYANDSKLRLENMRELSVTNLWNSSNRVLMYRDKKAFRAINKYLSAGVNSEYSDVITFDDQEEVLIDKVIIYKKNVTALAPADQDAPIAMTDPDASVIKVFVRQGGTYYTDFFLNKYDTNKNDDYYDYDSDYNKTEIPNYLVTSVTLDSRFPMLKIKDGCLYGNKYNYTVYLFDEFGRTSDPISIVL
jgi:hypothetical protein